MNEIVIFYYYNYTRNILKVHRQKLKIKYLIQEKIQLSLISLK